MKKYSSGCVHKLDFAERVGWSSSSGKSAKSKFPYFFSYRATIIIVISAHLDRCGLDLFYRHSNQDEGVNFIFPGSVVRSGEKPVTTMKAEPVPEPPKKRSKVSPSLRREDGLMLCGYVPFCR